METYILIINIAFAIFSLCLFLSIFYSKTRTDLRKEIRSYERSEDELHREINELQDSIIEKDATAFDSKQYDFEERAKLREDSKADMLTIQKHIQTIRILSERNEKYNIRLKEQQEDITNLTKLRESLEDKLKLIMDKATDLSNKNSK